MSVKNSPAFDIPDRHRQRCRHRYHQQAHRLPLASLRSFAEGARLDLAPWTALVLQHNVEDGVSPHKNGRQMEGGKPTVVSTARPLR